MAGFRTHITISSLLGVGYGATGYALLDLPVESCVLASALCGVSGMLPDVDSDSGVPLRESLAFAAAAVPMMLVDRFRHMGWPSESIVLAGAAIYLAIRFGFGWLLKRFTVHRGMFHSLPAAVIAGEVAFLLASGSLGVRVFKAMGVVAGFMSHLLLDEIYSVDLRRVRIKKSFGTAVKFWSDNRLATCVTYLNVLLLTFLVLNDKIWVDAQPSTQQMEQLATSILDRFKR